MWNNLPSSTRESAIADLPGAISKALASLTERVDQIEGKGTLEARMFGNGEDRTALAFLDNIR
jgi:hypothetical protein